MRTTFLVSLAAGSLLAPAAAVAEPVTTRIETRPFYGATVTLEEGVRVFRPLPPHDRVIINPGGRTPLNLSYEEQRSVSHNYYYSEGGASDGGAAASSGGFVPFKPIRRHGHVPTGARGPSGHAGGGHR
jgi:hypothetical protein